MANKKVLIIDDEPDLANLVKNRLEYHGYQVDCLNTGRDAVKIAQETNPDLIILDIMLPDKNGYDICYELKHNANTSSIPVILFTAKQEWKAEMGEIGKFAKADDYISKPFEPQVLLDKIKRLLKE